MSLYWIHVRGGTDRTAFGPFENPEVHLRFRVMYADEENALGYVRSVDELPELPGTGEQDDHEVDTWIPVQADSLFLLDGYDTFAVKETDTFIVTDKVTRVEPMLSE